MLEQNTSSEANAGGYVSPVANLRATPQEIAQAVAALEAQKMQTSQMDTVAIGDAIRQLGLNVTPQELYAEIYRQQAQERNSQAAFTPQVAAVQTQTTRRRTQIGMAPWIVVACCGVMASMFFFTRLTAQRRIASSDAMMMQAVANEMDAPPQAVIAGMPPPPMNLSFEIPASEVTNDQPGYATLDQLYEMANGKEQAQVIVRSNQEITFGGPQWKLIRRNGELLVRGWTYPGGAFQLGEQPVKGAQGNFFSNPYNPNMTQRTLPLKAFKNVVDPTWSDVSGSEGLDLSSQAKR